MFNINKPHLFINDVLSPCILPHKDSRSSSFLPPLERPNRTRDMHAVKPIRMGVVYALPNMGVACALPSLSETSLLRALFGHVFPSLSLAPSARVTVVRLVFHYSTVSTNCSRKYRERRVVSTSPPSFSRLDLPVPSSVPSVLLPFSANSREVVSPCSPSSPHPRSFASDEVFRPNQMAHHPHNTHHHQTTRLPTCRICRMDVFSITYICIFIINDSLFF